jgi:alpha-D-ribose 1-methylphosphonate 5-triphosphate synthase subunit PhnH
MTAVAKLPTGFADKVLAAQSTFRAVMEALARPGSVQPIAASVGTPAPMMHATAAIALTLFDHDTPIWLDHRMAGAPVIAKWLRFHTAAPVTADASACQFALIGDGSALPDLDGFSLGSNEYPDRSTTLILQVESLGEGPGYVLQGPGIDGTALLRATIAPGDLFERLAVNATLFPRGIDVVLVHDDAIVAIPRTTRLIGKEG